MRTRYSLVPTTITADSAHAVERFGGWSVRESAATAAAATVRFRDTNLAGQILAVVEVPADGSETVVLDPALYPDGGVYVEVVAGTVEGVIYDWR